MFMTSHRLDTKTIGDPTLTPMRPGVLHGPYSGVSLSLIWFGLVSAYFRHGSTINNLMKHLKLFESWGLEEKASANPAIYKAPEGSARDKKLDKAKDLLKKGDKQAAYRLRDEMEKQERSKPGWKNTPRPDSQVNEANLSKETLAKIRKVATKKGYSFADLKREYVKGLGAFYSSGSRPGMTAHGWAMARVNAAGPSKSWAHVKKTK